MKRYSWISLIFMLLICANSFGAIITVDNKYPYAGQYSTLQEAHDAASDGDVLYVSPSLQPYNAITVVKKLVFYGVGFDPHEIAPAEFYPTAIISGNMQFDTGSSGSQIEGFDGSFNITIRTTNITVKRNDLSRVLINGGSGSAIINNKFIGIPPEYRIGGINSGYFCQVLIETGSSIMISNNIFINLQPAIDWTAIITIWGGSDLIIKNNIISNAFEGRELMSVSNSLVINNILWSGYVSGSNNIYRCNFGNATQLPIEGGNITNEDINAVIENKTIYDFHLKSGSPALGTGENGVDMGIYGGDTPYIDRGFPSLPSILQLNGDFVASPGSGLNIQFKAKSNK